MARSEAQRERHQYRKTQQMIEQTHGGFAGRSILEMLLEKLDHSMDCYLDARAKGWGKNDSRVATCRGEVRGMARAIALMQNPYYPTRAIKDIEQDSARRVRRQRAEEPAEGQVEAGAEAGAGEGERD